MDWNSPPSAASSRWRGSSGENLPVSVKKTFLGLHSLPPEFAARRQRFIDEVSGPWLAALAADGLVDAVDSFCEKIAFSVAETEQFLQAAKRLNLGAHVHAGQLSDIGAAQLAAKWGALSADHLEYLSAERRACHGSGGHCSGVVADGLFHLAPDDSAAGGNAARRGRAAGAWLPTRIPAPRPAPPSCLA